MKASDGSYYCGLDHIRALAAFMVFNWHFMYGFGGVVDNSTTPVFIFSFLNQGHTGVALFMTLSGYLFAKLINTQHILYTRFLWNRGLRLLPLLIITFILVGMIKIPEKTSLAGYLYSLSQGLLRPTWPAGSWSIAIEMKYYIILPCLLAFMRNSTSNLIYIVLIVFCLRISLFFQGVDLERLSYWTLVGRIDQFLLGMVAFKYAPYFKNKHNLFGILAVAFLFTFWIMSSNGLFYDKRSWQYPFVWTYLPLMEGAFYGVFIAWYDQNFSFMKKGLSGVIADYGKFSYSIYLLHFFLVFETAKFIDQYIMDLSSFYVALVWSLLCFICMYIPGLFSYKFIEKPFLKFRKQYLVPHAEKKQRAAMLATQ